MCVCVYYLQSGKHIVGKHIEGQKVTKFFPLFFPEIIYSAHTIQYSYIFKQTNKKLCIFCCCLYYIQKYSPDVDIHSVQKFVELCLLLLKQLPTHLCHQSNKTQFKRCTLNTSTSKWKKFLSFSFHPNNTWLYTGWYYQTIQCWKMLCLHKLCRTRIFCLRENCFLHRENCYAVFRGRVASCGSPLWQVLAFIEENNEWLTQGGEDSTK